MMVPSYFEANVAAAIEEAKRAMLAAGRNGDTFNGGKQEKVIGIMNDIRQQFTEASPHFLAVYGNHKDPIHNPGFRNRDTIDCVGSDHVASENHRQRSGRVALHCVRP